MISTPFFAPLIYAKDEGGLHDVVSLHRCQHMRMRAGTLFIYCMPSARCVPATVLFDLLYNQNRQNATVRIISPPHNSCRPRDA